MNRHRLVRLTGGAGRILVASCLVLGLGAAQIESSNLGSGHGPSPGEWSSIRAEVRAGVPGALGRLMTMTARYPAWIDGRRELATAQLAAGNTEAALASARAASSLGDLESLGIEIRALGILKRPAEAYTVVDVASDRDLDGWLHYEAGLVAVAAGHSAKAESFLGEARARAVGRIPPEFQYLESRIAVAVQDYAKAEQALSSAVLQRPDYWTGWFDLARVRTVLADRDPDNRQDYLNKADEAIAKVVAGVPGDPDVLLVQARISWLLGRTLARAGEETAVGRFTSALSAAQGVLSRKESLEAVKIAGDSAIHLGRWAEAVTYLSQAQRQGPTERGVAFSLASAHQHLGHDREAAAVLASLPKASPAEDLEVAVDAYEAKNWGLAHRYFLSGAVGATPETVASALRYAGLAAAQIASAATGDEQRQWLDKARDAWSEAVQREDALALRLLVVQESQRGPASAYAVGWRLLREDSWLSGEGWGLVLGNYGPAISGGQGPWGVLVHHPGHALAWLTLMLGPLGWWVWRWWRSRHQSPSYVPTHGSAVRPSVSGRLPVTGGTAERSSARLAVVGKPATSHRLPAVKSTTGLVKPPVPISQSSLVRPLRSVTGESGRAVTPIVRPVPVEPKPPVQAQAGQGTETMQAAPFNPDLALEPLERRPGT